MNQFVRDTLFHHVDLAVQHLVTASVELSVEGAPAYATVGSFSMVLPWLKRAYQEHQAVEAMRAAMPHLVRIRELDPGALDTWGDYLDNVAHGRVSVQRLTIHVLLDEIVELRARLQAEAA